MAFHYDDRRFVPSRNRVAWTPKLITNALDVWHSLMATGSPTLETCRGDVRVINVCAGVVELVDAPDSKSGSARSVGSIPTARTIGIR